MNNPALLERIEAFDIDGKTAAYPFSKRLAQENGWSRDFSLRAIREYKRFAYLCMVAGPCSPSDVVDQVWHLHMIYTESYWDRWCGDVLPKPLRHGPSQGGSEEAAKFEDWYAHTLEAYRSEFGEDPPADLWPLQESGRFQRVNLDNVWVVDKARVQRLGLVALFGMALAGLAGCAHLATAGGSWGVMICLAPFILFLIIVAVASSASHKSRNGSNGGSGCGSFHGCGSHGDSGGGDGGGSSCGSGCGGGCGGGD